MSVVEYDKQGRANLTTNPKNIQTKTIFDDMDRVIATIENFDDADLDSPAWDTGDLDWDFTGIASGSPAEDRVTSTVYLLTATPPMIKRIAHTYDATPAVADQVTQYVFGVTKNTGADDSRITSNDLLAQIIYPDVEGGESTPDHSMYFAYNRLGEQKFTKDQAGTQHHYTLDALGRVTVDLASDFGYGIDSTIDAITYEFDAFGRTELVQSHNDYTGTPTVKNAVKFEYTTLWQVEKVWQQHDDVVDGSSPKVTYAYSTSSNTNKNYSRVTSMTYPHGSNSLPYEYGDADSSNDLASRMTKVNIHGGGPPTNGVEYSYIGAGLVALVDMAGPSGSLNVMLTRFHAANGTSSQGVYPGFDQFGRVKRHIWADGDFDGITGTPRIVDLSFTYDRNSNIETANNTNDILSGWAARDSKFTNDDLDRLITAQRGTTGSPFVNAASSSAYTPGQSWTLDFLGNMQELISDTDADGPDSGDNIETRDHNDGNEVTSLDPDGSGGAAAFTITHDKVGNITSRHQTYTDSDNFTKYTYMHDAWNRLVKVTFGGVASGSELSDYDVAVYEYNGLSWRVTKRADTSLPTINGLDEMHVYIYSAGWQMLEDHVDVAWGGSTFTQEKVYQVIYGLRYIDDVVCRRLDSDLDGDYKDVGGSETYYHLSDNQFSTVAVLDVNANVLERVSYDAYGRARHHQKTDLTGDGGTNVADLLTVIGNWGSSGTGDLNRDGTVGVADQGAVISGWGSAETLGVLSTTGNVFGFSGYVFNSEVAGNGGRGADRAGIYIVRFRQYDVGLGRWLERDPLEYVDGMSMYQYGIGQPLCGLDPFGLSWWEDLKSGATATWEFTKGAVVGAAITVGAAVAVGAIAVFSAPIAVAVGAGLLVWGAFSIYDTMSHWGELSFDEKAYFWGNIFGGIAGGFLGPKGFMLGNKIGKGIRGRLAKGVEVPGGKAYIEDTGCFVAGTLVCVAAGLTPIEEVHAGDLIWSYDADKSSWVQEEVNAVNHREYQGDVVTLRIDFGDGTSEEITCTGNHPFWVVSGDRLDERPAVAELPIDQQKSTPSGRWTEARWLKLGDRFLTRTGYIATVSGLTIRMDRVKVYNLQVNRLSLYAVGSAGVLVHNSTRTLYHKGNMNGGKVSPTRSLSTTPSLEGARSIRGNGPIWRFIIPERLLRLWEEEGPLRTYRDFDNPTATENIEYRFSPSVSEILNSCLDGKVEG